MARARHLIPAPLWLALAAAVIPNAVVFWLLGHPRQNVEWLIPHQHVLVVANVSLLAAAVAALVSRMAIQMGHHGLLFVGVGFMSLAGLFSLHAIATPGVLLGGHMEDYGGTITGLSAYLSLLVPSLLFSARHLGVSDFLANRVRHAPRNLLLGVIVALGLFAAVSLRWSEAVAQIPLSRSPFSHGVAAVTILGLLFAAWHEAKLHRKSGSPLHGALVVAFTLLASAQVSMALGPVWTVAWWQYHALMLIAVALALGALYFELDHLRRMEERRHKEEMMEAQIQAAGLMRAEAYKTELIGVVSHELRSPVAALHGFSELLLSHQGSETDRRHWLTLMNDEAARLGTILDDLLHASRIEAGEVQLRMDQVVLGAIVEEMARKFAARAPGHRFHVAGEPHVVVHADSQRVTQILENLVSNAVKYSPEGGTITIGVKRAEGNAVISVSDQGLGIPPEDVPKLFTRFHRVHRPEHSIVRGTGLGLYITKELVTRQGGAIWVESQPGEGSTFSFALQLERGTTLSNEAGPSSTVAVRA